jgi:hypothetical protein
VPPIYLYGELRPHRRQIIPDVASFIRRAFTVAAYEMHESNEKIDIPTASR